MLKFLWNVSKIVLLVMACALASTGLAHVFIFMGAKFGIFGVMFVFGVIVGVVYAIAQVGKKEEVTE